MLQRNADFLARAQSTLGLRHEQIERGGKGAAEEKEGGEEKESGA